MTSYPENYDPVWEKYQAKGFDALSELEQLIFCIWWLEGEVNNGGFHQFFLNSWGDYCLETLSALEKIGADKTKELLERACNVAFNGLPPGDRDQRLDVLDGLSESVLEELYSLDKKFYDYEDNIEELVNRYLDAKGR